MSHLSRIRGDENDSLDATDEVDFARRLSVEFCKVDGWDTS